MVFIANIGLKKPFCQKALSLDPNNMETLPEGTQTKPTEDPYFYTRGKEFTSEIYKLEIINLPNYVGYTQLKKLLGNKLKLKPHKIKLINQTVPVVFVTFRCEEDRENALDVLKDFQWKGRTLQAKKANPSADPLIKKRNEKMAGLGDVHQPTKIAKRDNGDQPVELRLKNAVTPLWNVPYSQQLLQKQEAMKDVLVKLGRQMQKTNPHILSWLARQRKENEGLCCRFLPICPSPVEDFYRNKCEFNVGLHPETGVKSVGFRISSYKAGSKCVAPPVGLPNLPSSMISAAKCFEEFIQNSKRDIFNPETNEGYWRQLTVRIAGSNLMLIVGMHPQDLTQEEISEEKEEVKGYFGPEGKGFSCNPSCLYFQEMRRKVSEDEVAPPELMWESQKFEETLLGMKLAVGPNAFFQVNTLAAEVLYGRIAEMALVDGETVVVDLCCGTGVIGLSLAQHVSKVVGIEMCSQAVEDARRNAQFNGVSNAEFICGKVEDCLHDVLRRLSGCTSILAIADPPRAGLHSKVIKCIRGAESLGRLVYVSCSPQAALTNFIDLCRPTSNSYKGQPFQPVCAQPVDLFPHTSHCEMLLLLQRCQVV